MALGRLGDETQVDSGRIDGLQGLIDRRNIDLDRLAPLVEIFLADASAWQELLAPFEVGPRQFKGCLPALEGRDIGSQIGGLGVNVLDGVLELEPIGPGLGHQAAHLGLGGHQVRLGRHHRRLFDRNLIREGFLVELDQQVPLLHAIVVVDQHPAHLA